MAKAKTQRDDKMIQVNKELSDVEAQLNELRDQRDVILRALASQGELLRAIAAKIDAISARETEMRQMVLEIGRRVLRRENKILEKLDELELNRADTKDSSVLSKRWEYRRLIRSLRRIVRDELPRDATVLVVGKGDQKLLKLDVRRAWHFPQQSPQTPIADGGGGVWAGYHPAGSTACIVQVEMLRSKGANYLVFPKTSLWWLEHYAAFRRYLERRYKAVVRRDDTCVIYSLAAPRISTGMEELPVWAKFDNMIAEFEDQFDRTPAILDWNTGLGLASRFPQYSVFSPPEAGAALPYISQSVDIVAIATSEPEVVEEARRVASVAVARFFTGKGTKGAEPGMEVLWLAEEADSTLPSASIVIPSYNGINFTEPCVLALFETLPKYLKAEIIVVDDASTDDTQTRLAPLVDRDPRLRVVRNEKNSGFIYTCNRGAAEATGDVVILLNNDTIPLPGWLPPLLRVLRDQKDAGAVGGKLLFPDGRMQEAGGIVFRDGTAANFGKWDYDPDDPLYNFVREVDYCSGALLATWRSLFLELGGLDLRYRPIYCDDCDYGFQVRAKGLKVYYQPESSIIHIEGGTSGTDEKQGDKRYQVINRGKLVEKWAEAMKRQPVNPHRFDRASLHRLTIREEYQEDGEQVQGWDNGQVGREER